MKMKVLYLTNIPSPYRVDFFNGLGLECDLTVVYERRTATDRNKDWLSKKAINYKEIFLNGAKIKNDSALCLGILNFLNNDFDIIVVGGYSTPTGMLAISYMKMKKISFIINCDGGMKKNDNCIKYLIKKFFISSAHSWLSTSKESTNYLVHYGANERYIYKYPFTSLKQVDVLDAPISYQEKKNYRMQLGIEEENIIISVGQFIPRKGFDLLIKAAKSFENETGIYIIGGKVNKDYLEIIEEYNIKNVRFIDFKDKNQLIKYYRAADIFVLPTREDIWGLVVNEAMANGLPIITSDRCVAGIELIEDNINGYIVPNEGIEELKNKILILLEDKLLRYSMGVNNLLKIKNYTIESMVKSHMNIFESYIKKMKEKLE